MTDEDSAMEETASSWDNFWHGATYQSAYSNDGSTHPVIRGFWDDFFASVRSEIDEPRLIDVAGGAGAVAESARQVLGDRTASFTCVDISRSAMALLSKRFPDIMTIVADARSIPLKSEQFDLVTSQFGIEYAGLKAIDELLRLVAPGGRLAMLLHHRHGEIFRQCDASRDAVEKMITAQFVPRSLAMLDAGFQAALGGDRADYEQQAKALRPAIRVMESILQEHGNQVADGAILQIYRDVRDISGKLRHYDRTEVLEWLRRMETEVRAYAGRMSSMCEAAIDGDTYAQVCRRIETAGYSMLQSGPLVNEQRGVPLAWSIIASKG